MPTIYLTLAGPQQAPYPNGGDEAYWMGQVAGALVSHLNHRGIPLAWGRPEKPEALWLALSSQAAPPEQEGQKKGPLVLFQEGDPQSQRMAACLADHLAQAYPQPEFLLLEGRPQIPELEGAPCPGVALHLLYRDNPQDEAWIVRNTGPVGKALAQGLEEACRG